MTVRIIQGDCREVLKTLPDESVHCVITSPPYWRQRDYGNAAQIGLEQTPEEYIAEIVAVFAECWRVLRQDGSAWINVGDKWASGGNGGGGSYMAERGEAWAHTKQSKDWRSPPVGYKDKDLVGLPFMLAFAMRAHGWFWRQCNVWAKPNGMPESVRDRSTISHEYVLQFSKNKNYWYDADAARTPAAPLTETRLAQDIDNQAGSSRANGGAKTNGPMKAVGRKLTGSPHGRHADTPLPPSERRSNKQRGHSRKHQGFNDRWDAMEREGQLSNRANLRSVWWIATANYKDGHYAVMPDALAEICIRAGCPKDGVVLDPFGGAGTTGLVADRLGRNAIMIELNPDYTAMAERRIKADGGIFAEVAAE